LPRFFSLYTFSKKIVPPSTTPIVLAKTATLTITALAASEAYSPNKLGNPVFVTLIVMKEKVEVVTFAVPVTIEPSESVVV